MSQWVWNPFHFNGIKWKETYFLRFMYVIAVTICYLTYTMCAVYDARINSGLNVTHPVDVRWGEWRMKNEKKRKENGKTFHFWIINSYEEGKNFTDFFPLPHQNLLVVCCGRQWSILKYARQQMEQMYLNSF